MKEKVNRACELLRKVGIIEPVVMELERLMLAMDDLTVPLHIFRKNGAWVFQHTEPKGVRVWISIVSL